MDSREDILNRVRRRIGRTHDNAAEARRAMLEWLAARTRGPRHEIEADLVARFRSRSEQLSSTVDGVERMEDVPAAAARYLVERALPMNAICTRQVADLAWAEAGISADARSARNEDLVGITGCFCAIADTGTIMLCSSRESAASVSLLPETHIAVIPASRIVAGMEEAWQLARDELGELPRGVNFVSGPSRTGDIEQTIVLGAHGPCRVHLIVVG